MLLRHRYKIWVVAIMLAGSFLRIVGIVSISPPGPEHDEVANWLIDRAIMAGEHGVYFTQAYGHEAGFHYWQTLFVWLVGDNLVALRASAALMGMLALAVTYALSRRLFGRELALLSTALIATLFFPIFYSRLALRAISLPVTAGLSICFFWDWLNSDQPKRLNLLFAALFAGLSSYTYMASRALPIFFIGWFVYLAIIQWQLFKSIWRDLLLFLTVYLIISWPLIQFLQTLPDGETRIGEIDAPLRTLLTGDLQPILNNGIAIFLGFGFSGDPLWRQGVAFQPIFEPIFAGLFYIGLAVSIWKWREIRYGFLLLWLAAAVVPSLVTVDAPSTIRMILMVPILGIFPVIGLDWFLGFLGFSISRTPVLKNGTFIHSYPQLSPGNRELSTRKLDFAWLSLLTAFLMLFYGIRSGRDIFVTWPNNDEVQFVWQQSLTEIGRDIDNQIEIDHFSLAGWTPETMDAPTMRLVIKRDDASIRHFGRVGEIDTLVIPSEPHIIYRPSDLPFNPALEKLLAPTHLKDFGNGYVSYKIQDSAQYLYEPVNEVFFNPTSGFEVEFLGYQYVAPAQVETVKLISFWRVERLGMPLAPNSKLFLHLVDSDGNLLAQHDGLNAPHLFWQEEDLLMQIHSLEMVDGAVELRIGVYEGTPPWTRFVIETKTDYVTIPLNR